MSFMGVNLRTIREARGMDVRALAAFTGISVPGYWDVEGIEGEANVLNVCHVVRLCFVFRIDPADLQDDTGSGLDAEGHGLGADGLETVISPSEDGGITPSLRQEFSGADQQAFYEIWERDAVLDWISSDDRLFYAPFPALLNLCEFLNIDFRQILQLLLRGLGVTSSMNESP